MLKVILSFLVDRDFFETMFKLSPGILFISMIGFKYLAYFAHGSMRMFGLIR